MTNRKEAEEFTTTFVNEVVLYIRNNHNKSFTCNLKMDWSPRRTTNYGGEYKTGIGINMAMRVSVSFAATYTSPVLLSEYRSFQRDPVIGNFWSHTWQLKLKAELVHEIAHVWCAFTKDKMDHGTVWKHKYAILRKKFVNPYINKELNTRITQPGSEEYKRLSAKEAIEKSVSLQLYLEKCATIGLTPEHLNKWYTIKDREYKIIGWNKKARVNFLTIERDDGKIFVTDAMGIKTSARRDINSSKAASRKK